MKYHEPTEMRDRIVEWIDDKEQHAEKALESLRCVRQFLAGTDHGLQVTDDGYLRIHSDDPAMIERIGEVMRNLPDLFNVDDEDEVEAEMVH